MQLTLLPDQQLELEICEPSESCPFGSYELVGPDNKVTMLRQLIETIAEEEKRTKAKSEEKANPSGNAPAQAETAVNGGAAPIASPARPGSARPGSARRLLPSLSSGGSADAAAASSSSNGAMTRFTGMLSPRAPVTLPDACREAAGIPAEAATFCFSYPAEGMEATLESLNLTAEPWGYFLLVGGFCFFGADGTLLECAALTLVPTRWMLHFDGPLTPTPEALKALRDQKRMFTVTIDALESAGFEAFGWAHAAGAPHETVRITGADVEYPHGGFLYDMIGDEHNFFALKRA